MPHLDLTNLAYRSSPRGRSADLPADPTRPQSAGAAELGGRPQTSAPFRSDPPTQNIRPPPGTKPPPPARAAPEPPDRRGPPPTDRRSHHQDQDRDRGAGDGAGAGRRRVPGMGPRAGDRDHAATRFRAAPSPPGAIDKALT